MTSRRWASHNLSYHEALSATETKISALKNQLRVATEETGATTATVSIYTKQTSISLHQYQAVNIVILTGCIVIN